MNIFFMNSFINDFNRKCKLFNIYYVVINLSILIFLLFSKKDTFPSDFLKRIKISVPKKNSGQIFGDPNVKAGSGSESSDDSTYHTEDSAEDTESDGDLSLVDLSNSSESLPLPSNLSTYSKKVDSKMPSVASLSSL